MKIIIPKPIIRDVNALDAKSRRAGPMRNSKFKRIKKPKLQDHLKEYE